MGVITLAFSVHLMTKIKLHFLLFQFYTNFTAAAQLAVQEVRKVAD